VQPETGHLVKMPQESEGFSTEELRQEFKDLEDKGYEELPESHVNAAMKKLGDKTEAYVSLTSGGKLSSWAAQKRKEKKEKYNKRLGSKEVNRRRAERSRRSSAKKPE
jgi:hypothetical protein